MHWILLQNRYSSLGLIYIFDVLLWVERTAAVHELSFLGKTHEFFNLKVYSNQISSKNGRVPSTAHLSSGTH